LLIDPEILPELQAQFSAAASFPLLASASHFYFNQPNFE